MGRRCGQVRGLGSVGPLGERRSEDETFAVSAVREEDDATTTDLALEVHAVLRSGSLSGTVGAAHLSYCPPRHELLRVLGRFG